MIEFLAGDLRKWDEMSADTLALSVFSDERPLRGAAGLADWRLSGRLSQLLRGGLFTGREGERLLMPPGRKLPFRTLMLFGLGPQAGFDETRFCAVAKDIQEALCRANVSSYALQLPGRSFDRILPRKALELWLETTGTRLQSRMGYVVDAPQTLGDVSDILRLRQRLEATGTTESGAVHE